MIHRLAGGTIAYSVTVLRCACGEQIHARGGAAALAAYRWHRARATARRPPARPAAAVLTLTKRRS